MLPLDAPVFSHISLRARATSARPRSTWRDVASDPGLDVHSYAELHRAIAWLGYKNRRFELFFRGHRGDHKTRTGRSTILPTLFRPPRGRAVLTAAEHTRRVALLRHYRRAITSMPRRRDWGTLWKYREAVWALLQHYEICPTPLLDITRSLHVAASFAVARHDSTDRYVYAFALPYTTGSITMSTVDDLLVLHLRNLMPAEAHRPHFQEGYLVGCTPRATSRASNHDLAVRLVGKFRIPAKSIATFWSDSHAPIHDRFLMPDDDPVLSWLAKLPRL